MIYTKEHASARRDKARVTHLVGIVSVDRLALATAAVVLLRRRRRRRYCRLLLLSVFLFELIDARFVRAGGLRQGDQSERRTFEEAKRREATCGPGIS